MLVAFAMMIPWLLAGLSSHLCTRAGERVKVCLPVDGAERLPTCDPLSSEPLLPATSQALPVAYCSQVAADSTQGALEIVDLVGMGTRIGDVHGNRGRVHLRARGHRGEIPPEQRIGVLAATSRVIAVHLEGGGAAVVGGGRVLSYLVSAELVRFLVSAAAVPDRTISTTKVSATKSAVITVTAYRFGQLWRMPPRSHAAAARDTLPLFIGRPRSMNSAPGC